MHFYDQGYSLWLHRKPVNQSIYRFKYQNQRRFAAHYTAELTRAFEGQVRRWRPCLIMPVPLHKKRRRARGYNQAELIAEGLGRAFDAAAFALKQRGVQKVYFLTISIGQG